MKWYYLVVPLVTIAAATAGSRITEAGMSWYQKINLPSFTPPGAVIGLVWTVIFILSVVGMILALNQAKADRFWLIFGIFFLNMALNFFWSWLFFGQHLLGAAVWEAAILDLSVIALVILIWPVSRVASILFLPYAGWVAFATYLTYSVFNLNR